MRSPSCIYWHHDKGQTLAGYNKNAQKMSRNAWLVFERAQKQLMQQLVSPSNNVKAIWWPEKSEIACENRCWITDGWIGDGQLVMREKWQTFHKNFSLENQVFFCFSSKWTNSILKLVKSFRRWRRCNFILKHLR